MDENCTKWSYATPTTGRMPESGKEISMDTAALELLGVTPRLGAEVPLTFTVTDKDQTGDTITESFTLVGYWEYDNLMAVHYINISKDYADEVEKTAVAAGMDAFRMDLNVMLASSADIEGQMEQVDTDLGYTWDSYTDENSVRIGANWGYTTYQLGAGLDLETVIAVLAFLLLVIFTGYLIIYNIFQISVTGDIRFYGLLKTIGTTPRQVRRMIRQQAFALSVVGIPLGLLLGYGVGALLVPVILRTTTLGTSSVTISGSPLIFLGAALFALLTVFFSCRKPGKMAGKVSPVEAVRYTEVTQTKRKNRRTRRARSTRGAKISQMAFANLGRNRKKTVLVVLSLALSVVLLNCLCTLVGGFSMEAYESEMTCADFIVSSTDYFNSTAEEYLTEDSIEQIAENTKASLSGVGYAVQGNHFVWMDEDALRTDYSYYGSEDELDSLMENAEHRGNLVMSETRLEALDKSLFEKLTVVDGDISPMLLTDNHAIAVAVSPDDDGNIPDPEYYPQVGDTLTMTYAKDVEYIDSRTGELCTEDTPEEYIEEKMVGAYDVDYTVCALVEEPYSMSYRYYGMGYDTILSAETAKRDSSGDVVPMIYVFDTPDEASETAAEEYLADLTESTSSPLMYESKATVRAEFSQYEQMFLLVGGVLCTIIALVGILNFFNSIMTGILSRRREFAVIQSVGMTSRQLRAMLIYEGLFYALSSVSAALILSLVLEPLAGKVLASMYWFYDYHFTIFPVLLTIPVFVVLGVLIPMALYGQAARQSVVERLREAE
jgi:putative ABC transport system permease protein